ncbi:uncharacterized protein LOC142352250 isoform X2 [Convolutriloba macropyga]|uniref:uncharacterized protein LOC142352250 isoform X2 n=1 Tax=Convolutriloba macropyga TaxID=536237 RepID=UPI003F51B075
MSSLLYSKNFTDALMLKCEAADVHRKNGYDSGIASLNANSPFSSSALSPSGSTHSPSHLMNLGNGFIGSPARHIQRPLDPPPLIGPAINSMPSPVSGLLNNGTILKTSLLTTQHNEASVLDLPQSCAASKDCETISSDDLWQEFCRINQLDGRKPQRRRRQACQKIESGGKCKICSDTATGFHYDVLSCEGCKGFFRRSVTSNTLNRCASRAASGMKCDINIFYRRKCQECRFISCLEAGMRPASLSTTQPGKSKKPRQNFIPGVPPTSLLQPSHPGLHHASPYQKSLLSPPSVTSQHLQNGFPHHPSHHHHHHHLVTTTGVPHRPPPPNERAAAVAVAALLNSPHHLLPGPPAVAGPPGVLDHTGSAKSPGGSVLPTHPFGHHVTQVSHATSLLLDANHKRSLPSVDYPLLVNPGASSSTGGVAPSGGGPPSSLPNTASSPVSATTPNSLHRDRFGSSGSLGGQTTSSSNHSVLTRHHSVEDPNGPSSSSPLSPQYHPTTATGQHLMSASGSGVSTGTSSHRHPSLSYIPRNGGASQFAGGLHQAAVGSGMGGLGRSTVSLESPHAVSRTDSSVSSPVPTPPDSHDSNDTASTDIDSESGMCGRLTPDCDENLFKFTSTCKHQEQPYGPLRCTKMTGTKADYFHSLVNALEMYGPNLMQSEIYIPTRWPSEQDCAILDPNTVHYMRKKHLTEITVLCINALIECFKQFEHFYGRFDEQVLFHLMCKSFLEMLMIYMAQYYNPERKTLKLLSGIELDQKSLQSGGLANFCEPMLKFAEMCHELDLQKEEYYLLGALILFQPHKISEDLDLEDKAIDRNKCVQIRDTYLDVLEEYEKLHRPREVARHLVPRMLLLLADLSELRHVHEKFFDEFDVNAPIQAELRPPLLKSIWTSESVSPESETPNSENAKPENPAMSPVSTGGDEDDDDDPDDISSMATDEKNSQCDLDMNKAGSEKTEDEDDEETAIINEIVEVKQEQELVA